MSLTVCIKQTNGKKLWIHWNTDKKLCLHSKGERKFGNWISHNLIKYFLENSGHIWRIKLLILYFWLLQERPFNFSGMGTGFLKSFLCISFSSISVGLSMIATAWINNYQQSHWKCDPTHATIRKVRIPLILLIKTESMN